MYAYNYNYYKHDQLFLFTSICIILFPCMQGAEYCSNEFCTSTPTHQGGFFPEFVVKEKAVCSPISKPVITLTDSCSATPASNQKGELNLLCYT